MNTSKPYLVKKDKFVRFATEDEVNNYKNSHKRCSHKYEIEKLAFMYNQRLCAICGKFKGIV